MAFSDVHRGRRFGALRHPGLGLGTAGFSLLFHFGAAGVRFFLLGGHFLHVFGLPRLQAPGHLFLCGRWRRGATRRGFRPGAHFRSLRCLGRRGLRSRANTRGLFCSRGLISRTGADGGRSGGLSCLTLRLPRRGGREFDTAVPGALLQQLVLFVAVGITLFGRHGAHLLLVRLSFFRRDQSGVGSLCGRGGVDRRCDEQGCDARGQKGGRFRHGGLLCRICLSPGGWTVYQNAENLERDCGRIRIHA